MSDALARLSGRVDPVRLRLLLERAGWETVGQRADAYVRMRPPKEAGQSVLVPLNLGASDYPELLAAALQTLASEHSETWTRALGPQLTSTPSDALQFKKETAAPSGLIPWEEGQDLIRSARAALIAGAKAYRGNARHFSNQFGRFANRYVDTLLMGQTMPGSYIVTAYAPVDGSVPLRNSATANLGYDEIDVASTRAVTRALVTALTATREALEQYRSSASLAGFEENVERGVSYELTTAVRDLVSGSDGASITVEWDASTGGPDNQRHFTAEFAPSDAAVLDSAATQLATFVEEGNVTVVGRVHLLTRKEAGGPGVVGIDDGNRKYRVRLSDETQYHEAVLAHDEDRLVEVAGELSREGNLHWIYGAELSDPSDDRVSGEEQSPGFFDDSSP